MAFKPRSPGSLFSFCRTVGDSVTVCSVWPLCTLPSVALAGRGIMGVKSAGNGSQTTLSTTQPFVFENWDTNKINAKNQLKWLKIWVQKKIKIKICIIWQIRQYRFLCDICLLFPCYNMKTECYRHFSCLFRCRCPVARTLTHQPSRWKQRHKSSGLRNCKRIQLMWNN